MIVALLKWLVTQKVRLRSLCYIWTTEPPLRRSIQTEFQALLSSKVKISQVWGMPETGWPSTLFWPERGDPESAGRPLPGFAFKLVGEDSGTIHDDSKEGSYLSEVLP